MSLSSIDILELLILEINRWLCLVIFIFGMLGSILNLIIFSGQTFSKQSCSLYFLCISLHNLAIYLIGLTTRIIDDGYKLNLIFNTTTIYCKLRNYLVYTLFSISSWRYVLATFDRFYATNQSTIRKTIYLFISYAI